MKKLAIGVTLAASIAAAVACAPGDTNQNVDPAEQGLENQQYNNLGQAQQGQQQQFDGRVPGEERQGWFNRQNRVAPYANQRGMFGARGGQQNQSMTDLQDGKGQFGQQQVGRRGGIMNQDQNNQGNQGGLFGGQNQGNQGGLLEGDRWQGMGQNGGQRGLGPDGFNRAPFGRPDGQMQQDRGNMGGMNTGDNELARDIERRVENMDEVNDCRVLIHEDDIIVGVDTEGDGQEMESQIRGQVEEQAQGKQVHVTTEEDMINRMGNIRNNMQNGTPGREVTNDIGDLLNDLGRTITRPLR